jgi:hypothetical protein
MDKIFNFIVTDAGNPTFTPEFYRHFKPLYLGTNGFTLLIHNIDTFKELVHEANDNFKFRVLIHAEIRNHTSNIEQAEGLKVLKSLKRDFPSGKFLLISGEENILPHQGNVKYEFAEVAGARIYNKADLTNPDFFEVIDGDFVNTKREFWIQSAKESGSPSKDFTKNVVSAEKKEGEASHKVANSDFTILTALAEDEYEQFSNKLDVIADLGTNKKEVQFKKVASNKFSDYDKAFVIMRQERMGMVDAMASSTKAILDKNPKFLIMAGVCGGRKGKVKLYDIIIPSQTLDLVTGKIEMVDGVEKHVLYNYSSTTNNKLIEFLKEPERVTLIKNAMFALVENAEKKYNKIIGDVDIHFDDMACVPYVVNVDGYLEHNAKSHNGKICGLEMESYGVLRSNTLNQNDGHFSMVIKSVMDFTDGNKADSVGGENIKETAAYVSYLCTRAIMPHLIDFHDNKLWLK